MRVSTLLNAATEAGAGPTSNPQVGRNHQGIVQIKITGTAEVSIEGRLSDAGDWVVIKAYTATHADKISLFQRMRANVTSHSSGEVSAWLQHD